MGLDARQLRGYGGAPIDTPGITDIVPGSTFEGHVFWPYDPTAFSGHPEVYFPPPVIEFTVDDKYQFSSEMALNIFGGHGGFGVRAFASGPGIEDVTFAAGHGNLEVEILADWEVMTASVLAAADPYGEVDWLIGQDLTHFVSGQFSFGYSDYNGRLFFNPEGHLLELEGTITSLVVVSPEPATWIAASLASLIGVVLAWRRRKARLAS